MDRFEQDMVALYPTLRAYAQRLSLGSQDAEDLVQHAMMQALKARGSFIQGTNMRAWLMVILRNHYLTQVRRRKFTNRIISLDDEEHPVPDIGVWGNQEDAVFLREALEAMGTLPPAMQSALEMVGMEQLTYEEASEKANVLLGTIKSRAARGRALLAERVANGYPRARRRPIALPPKLKPAPSRSPIEFLRSLGYFSGAMRIIRVRGIKITSTELRR